MSPFELRTADGRGRYYGAWDLDILLGKDHSTMDMVYVKRLDEAIMNPCRTTENEYCAKRSALKVWSRRRDLKGRIDGE